jgi:glutaredoxin 3
VDLDPIDPDPAVSDDEDVAREETRCLLARDPREEARRPRRRRRREREDRAEGEGRHPGASRKLPRPAAVATVRRMTSPRVRVYTTTSCGYCSAAKRLLETEGIRYEEIDLTEDPARRRAVSEETGWRTVPMVFVDGAFVGGYRELMTLKRAGGLAALQDPGGSRAA